MSDNSHERAHVRAEHSLTPSENAIFTALGYGITPEPEHLPGIALREYYSTVDSVTEDECRTAMADCLRKGWVQIIDETTLSRIVDELRSQDCVGPIYGLPTIGGVDFTSMGADIWHRFSTVHYPQLGEPFAFADVVQVKTAHYFRSVASARAGLENMQKSCGDATVRVTDPYPVGPWRAQWWRRFASGLRIDVDENLKWQGSASGGGESCDLNWPALTADVNELWTILHAMNVSPEAWLILSGMENGTLRNKELPGGFTYFTQRHFNHNAGENEFSRGLSICLDCGWLQVIDQQVLDEIASLLDNDDAILAVPRTARLCPEGCSYDLPLLTPSRYTPKPMPRSIRFGEVDFTSAGAELYRTIMAAWQGPDWEDAFWASSEYYRVEHRYCESERGFVGIIDELQASGEQVLSSRVVPIGPWCVHWWEWFPTGFRLELEVGDSVLEQ